MSRLGDKVQTTDVGDWRVVDGVREAFRYRTHDGNPDDDATMTIDVLDHAPPPANAFARPADPPSDASFDGGDGSDGTGSDTVELPIEIADGGIVVLRGSIAGHPLDLIVDSGADGTVLNAARLAELGLTAVGAFAIGAGGGDATARYVRHVTLALPGVTLRDQTVAGIDFSALEGSFGRRIDGVLGFDFLSRFVVELDYRHARIRLHDPARFHRDDAGAIAITLDGAAPWLDAAIAVPGRPQLVGHFAIDTGCACQVALTTPFTDANHLLDAVATEPGREFAGAGGKTETVSGEITALRLGGVTIDHPTADFSRDHTGATADPDYAGLIGAGVFRNFVLVLDYAGGRMWLDPPT